MITNFAQGRQIVKEADTYSISSSLYLINTYQNVTESPSTCVQYSNSRLHFGYISDKVYGKNAISMKYTKLT